MTLTIELSSDEEARLTRAAQQEGVAPAALARKFLAERLVTQNAASSEERVRALLQKWQQEDNTPLAPTPDSLPGETPTQALFRTWAEEDARMTDAERAAEDHLWNDIESSLLQTQSLRLRNTSTTF